MNKSRLHYYLYKRGKSRKQLPMEHPESEISSIADIAFLLLIFFIVTSSFTLNEGIFFNLPSPNAGAQKIDPENLVQVTPLDDGFQIENITYSREEFSEKLNKKMKTNPEVVAIIHMTPAVKYERLIDAMSVIKENNMKRVSLKNDG